MPYILLSSFAIARFMAKYRLAVHRRFEDKKRRAEYITYQQVDENLDRLERFLNNQRKVPHE